MGKRSTFERRERDFYPTPSEAVAPLKPHLVPGSHIVEPCAGEGDLARHLEALGFVVVWQSDIEAKPELGIVELDVLELTREALVASPTADVIVTNPPWPAPHGRGEPVISIAKHLAAIRPTWLLLSADFAQNVYFSELEPICSKIVAVGRVSWMGNGTAGKDNAAWYLFDAGHVGQTRFYGRKAKSK